MQNTYICFEGGHVICVIFDHIFTAPSNDNVFDSIDI